MHRVRGVVKWRNVLLSGAAAALLLASGTISGCAGKKVETEAAAAAPAPYDREKTLESFEVVWSTVNEKHWDTSHAGVDWDAVHAEFRPKIEAATSTSQARKIMEEMLERLKQSHFAIWPRDLYLKDEPKPRTEGAVASGNGAKENEAGAKSEDEEDEIVDSSDGGQGVSGIDVRVVETDAIITRVQPGSAADAAGIRPGFLLLSAKGQKIERLAKRLEREEVHERSRDTMLSMLLQHLLVGDVGDTLEVEVKDGEGSVVKKELTLTATTGEPVTLGNMPKFYMTIESKMLPENVQYFTFSMFMDPVRLMPAFQTAVEGAQQADGFIIDVRGNPGGIGMLAAGMGGWLTEKEDIKLGTMTTRSGTFHFVLNPRVDPYLGPVAVLIDGMSGSTSEIFAGGLQDIGRARIFGERSAGAALPSVFDTLPNGDRFQYAIADYVSVSGKRLEGDGVTPDEVVKPDRESLLAGKDPVIEAALKWIKNEKAKATNGAGGGTN